MNKFPEHEKKNYKVGSYISLCLLCGHSFFGPKLCRICAECTRQPQEDSNG